MTEQEKRQQRADLLIGVEDAHTEYAHLRERVYRLADSFEDVVRTLRCNGTLKPSPADFDAELEIESRLKAEHQAIFDFQKTADAIEELRRARQRLFTLTERKAQLGTSSLSVTVPID